MTIDIAYRLVELRRKNGFSQEELAEKLGLSRQAVSKWERAEASPDTDNLIALARLYGVSLDELVGNCVSSEEPVAAPTENTVRVDSDGIHVNNGQESVHVGWHDIHVAHNGHAVHIDKNGVSVDGTHHERHRLHGIYTLIITLVYILLGGASGLWHPLWLLFLTIPVFTTLEEAIRRKDPNHFAYPILMLFFYLLLGFGLGWWHPTWVLFVTIPVYYAFFPHKHGEEDEE